MKPAVRMTLAALLAGGIGLAGCAQPGAQRTPEESSAAQARQPQETKTPAAPASPSLDPRQERQLVNDLLRAVEDYHRLLMEKNVERAVIYVDPQHRKAFQDDLWNFVARYKIESSHVESYQLFPQPDGVMAKVKVQRTVFEKHSVVPQRAELWMTWENRGGRWVLRPQQQK